ncbi:MAG: CoA pyrophosphatase [Pirellulales bacterium]
MATVSNLDVELPTQLGRRLQAPLPGPAAQRRFEPELSYGRHGGPPAKGLRPAAVLALLYPREDRWHIPLTLRPANLANHASQISLPGGRIEPGESAEAAALRELHEELGVPPGDVQLLGRLTPLVVYSGGFYVEPLVGVCWQPPAFDPSPAEVDQLLEMPLQWLCDDRSHCRAEQRRFGTTFSAPGFACQGLCVWGATAMMLAELVAVVGQRG